MSSSTLDKARIAGWELEVEPFRSGPRATVYRPTVTLFLLLKLARLSQRDLEDCKLAIAHAGDAGLAIDVVRVVAALRALAPTEDALLAERRSALVVALQPSG